MMSIVSVCYTHNSRSSIGYIWIAPAPGGRGGDGANRQAHQASRARGVGDGSQLGGERRRTSGRWAQCHILPNGRDRRRKQCLTSQRDLWQCSLNFFKPRDPSFSSLSQSSNYIFGGYPWRWNVWILASGSQLDATIWPSRYSCRWNAALKLLSPFQSSSQNSSNHIIRGLSYRK